MSIPYGLIRHVIAGNGGFGAICTGYSLNRRYDDFGFRLVIVRKKKCI